jgi:GABA(A) receptor-associated protein
MNFKKNHPFDKRLEESIKIKSKYSNRIPIIVEKDRNCKNLPDIDKSKYLVPIDLTFGQFVYVIRRRLKITPEKSIFLFCKNILPPTSITIKEFSEDKTDEDGFIYITYSGENTFG